MTRSMRRWLTAGLVFSIAGNVLIAFWVGGIIPVGNLTAVVICAFALWLVRTRPVDG